MELTIKGESKEIAALLREVAVRPVEDFTKERCRSYDADSNRRLAQTVFDSVSHDFSRFCRPNSEQEGQS